VGWFDSVTSGIVNSLSPANLGNTILGAVAPGYTQSTQLTKSLQPLIQQVNNPTLNLLNNVSQSVQSVAETAAVAVVPAKFTSFLGNDAVPLQPSVEK